MADAGTGRAHWAGTALPAVGAARSCAAAGWAGNSPSPTPANTSAWVPQHQQPAWRFSLVAYDYARCNAGHMARVSCCSQLGLPAGCCWMPLTCFTVHSKVLLALQHTVDYPGAAPICGVISIRRHHLHHRGACSRDKNKNKVREEVRRAAQTLGPGSWQNRRVGANTDHSHVLMKTSRTAVHKGSTTSPQKTDIQKSEPF